MSQGSSGAQAAEAEERVALAVSRERKERKRAGSKASIAKAQPIKVSAGPKAEPAGGRAFRQAWSRAAGDLSEAEQHKAVQQALEVFRQLPPASSYAQHRIRVLEKVLELLGKEGSDRSSEERDELQALLSQLKI